MTVERYEQIKSQWLAGELDPEWVSERPPNVSEVGVTGNRNDMHGSVRQTQLSFQIQSRIADTKGSSTFLDLTQYRNSNTT